MKDNVADTIVIGSGIAGSSIAFRLAERGQKVILLDKGRVGEEASTRNTGGVRQQDRDPAELPLAMEATKIWADMKEELDCDVGYRRGGNLMVARTEAQMEYLHRTMESELAMDLGVELLSPEETRRLNPLIPEDLEILGSKYCPTDGQADPLIAVKAICRAALRKGVKIKQYEPVKRLKAKGGRVTAAVTERGEYHSSYYVNAAGPWAKALCNTIGLDYPAALIKAKIFITEALPPMVEQYVIMDEMLYCQTLNGNFMIGVASDSLLTNVFEKSSELDSFIRVGRRLQELLPSFRNVNLLRSFAGLDHITPDSVAIVDKVPGFENLFMAAPLAGHGFCVGPIVGKLIAEWIVEGQSSMDLSRMRFNRFEGMDDFTDFTLEPSGFLAAGKE